MQGQKKNIVLILQVNKKRLESATSRELAKVNKNINQLKFVKH